MKLYTNPTMELISVCDEDVLTASYNLQASGFGTVLDDLSKKLNL